jgi:hypothetical protein
LLDERNLRNSQIHHTIIEDGKIIKVFVCGSEKAEDAFNLMENIATDGRNAL